MDIQFRSRMDCDGGRFILVLDGVEAGYVHYRVEPIGEDPTHARRIFDHTEIAERYRGNGYAGILIEEAINATEKGGYPYTATCSAVQDWLAKNR